MDYDLIITEKAETDLDQIINYIVETLCNVTAASHFLDEIEKRYEHCRFNPKIYSLCENILLKPYQYRKVIIGHYLMIIRIDEEKQIVYVERFFSQLEDFINKL